METSCAQEECVSVATVWNDNAEVLQVNVQCRPEREGEEGGAFALIRFLWKRMRNGITCCISHLCLFLYLV